VRSRQSKVTSTPSPACRRVGLAERPDAAFRLDPVPSTEPGTHGADPLEQARLAARELTRHTGAHRHDALVVLGPGLSPVARLLGAVGPAIDLTALPWSPRFAGASHRPEAWSLQIGKREVLVASGWLQLYEGRAPVEVLHLVRTAMATGCRTVVLTSMAGAVTARYKVGQVVAVSDHIDLTRSAPIAGLRGGPAPGAPFVDLTSTWSPTLRQLAREIDPTLAEGVFAQVYGPDLETPAESRMLATLGADLVGMSMVLEAIAAYHLGGEILGLAVVTNLAAGVTGEPVPVGSLTDIAARAAEPLAALIAAVIEKLESEPEREDPSG